MLGAGRAHLHLAQEKQRKQQEHKRSGSQSTQSKSRSISTTHSRTISQAHTPAPSTPSQATAHKQFDWNNQTHNQITEFSSSSSSSSSSSAANNNIVSSSSSSSSSASSVLFTESIDIDMSKNKQKKLNIHPHKSPSPSPHPSSSPAVSASASSSTPTAHAATSPSLTPARFVGAIDQGTSSTRFILFDVHGAVRYSHQLELTQIHPHDKPGWTEHDPEEIYQCVIQCIQHTMQKASVDTIPQVASVGITNQRETTVVWSKKTGKPLHNAIVWHDTRTSGIVSELVSKYGSVDAFRPSCGLPLSSYFSAMKLLWLLRHIPAVQTAVQANDACFGTIDSWLIYKLTNGQQHVTDVSNASRTMLMNLHTKQWDQDTLNKLDIPAALLPTIRSNSEVYGVVEVDGPLKGVPIAGCLGDQQAALLGQLCVKAGSAKNTYGTGCFMLLNTGTKPVKSKHGLLTTVAFQLGREEACHYALEGSVAVAGSGVQWLRDNLQLIGNVAEINTFAQQTNNACNDVYFVPAFSGLLSPYWRDDARGVFAGLTHSSTKADICRAVLYSAAYQTKAVLDSMIADIHAHDGQKHPGEDEALLHTLKVDGGMCNSDILMQFQADVLNIVVARPFNLEATAAGAAFAAGLAVGYWASLETLIESISISQAVRMFEPSMSEDERKKLVHGWNKAVTRTFGWIEKETTSLEVEEEKKLAAELKSPNHTNSPAASSSSSPSSSTASASTFSTTVDQLTSTCGKCLQSSSCQFFRSLLLVAIGGAIGFSVSKTNLVQKVNNAFKRL